MFLTSQRINIKKDIKVINIILYIKKKANYLKMSLKENYLAVTNLLHALKLMPVFSRRW